MTENRQKHIPVMLDEVLENLKPEAGKVYVDATFGNGGYTKAILEKASCKVIALDRDPNVKSRAEELKKEFGNRFEFRAVGSSANCGAAMTVINAAMAEQLNDFKNQVDDLCTQGISKDEAIFKVIKRLIQQSRNIRFEGDGYSENWNLEAEKRGLTNIPKVTEALLKYKSGQSQKVLLGEKIFTMSELESRIDVELEKYTKKVQIESRVLGDLAINHIVPTAVLYQNRLLENLRGLQAIFPTEEFRTIAQDRIDLVKDISKRVTAIKILVRDMIEARKKANRMASPLDKAREYENEVNPYLEKIRDHIDHLEMEVDDEIWPLPKYRELLMNN